MTSEYDKQALEDAYGEALYQQYRMTNQQFLDEYFRLVNKVALYTGWTISKTKDWMTTFNKQLKQNPFVMVAQQRSEKFEIWLDEVIAKNIKIKF